MDFLLFIGLFVVVMAVAMYFDYRRRQPKGISLDAGELAAEKSSPNSMSTLRSLLIVGVTYGVSAIALGWQFRELPKAGAFEELVPPARYAFAIGSVGIVATFVFGLVIGGAGLWVFHNLRKLLGRNEQDMSISDRVSFVVLLMFLIVWFGGWFLAPIVYLASATGGLSLAWLCLHLALTKAGWRMLVYIAYGATSLAVLFMGIVAASGNALAVAVLLIAQVIMLTILDRIAHGDRTGNMSEMLNLENIGIKPRSGWRKIPNIVVRIAFVVASIWLVFVYFEWRETMDAREEAFAADNESRRRLEAIGGEVFKHWNPEDGYTATLIKPQATDEDLVVLKEFSRIHELMLAGSSISDNGLKNLAHVKSIVSLDLSKTRVSDAGMAHLRDVEIQKTINLSGTQVTDETLALLRGLANVERVLLADTKVAGPGLQRLKTCRELFDLDLRNAPIYDDDIAFIRGLARDAKSHRVDFAFFHGLRVQLQGTNISIAEKVRLGELQGITVWGPREAKTGKESTHEVIRLGIHEATAINDKFQVVGWVADGMLSSKSLRRAVLLNPYDEDGDGRPDTYLKDSDQDGVNDQLVKLGTFRDWYGRPHITDINNRGQIIGYFVTKASAKDNWDFSHRGFVVDPLDADGDGEPDTWFKDGGDGKTNLLMKDLGTLGGKKCEPSAIDEDGRIIGRSDITYGVGRSFVIEPRDTDGDGKLEWFQSGEKPRLNKLMVETPDSLDRKASTDAQKTNSAGAELGTASSGRRRATVVIPR